MKTVDVPAVFGLSDYAPRPQIDTAARISLSQDEIDAALEREIEAARIRLGEAESMDAARAAWEEMRELMRKRSPARLAQMEAERKARVFGAG